MIGDGLSMGLGDYLSTKAHIDYSNKERDREIWEIDVIFSIKYIN